MLTPFAMLATKKRVCCQVLIAIAMAVVICGCAPAGTRALLKGKKYFDRGDYAGAAAQFKVATSLLATNASAWNYYGIALQRTGQPAEAADAYQRALNLNRDLMEAHYNLGCLWLEQDKPEAAKAEFTAFTLRRPNELDGWLKLGSAQLRTGELLAAERSFSTAYYLNTNSAESLNGLGLARVQRGRPREAAQFFEAAIQKKPDYAAAYLNLGTVADEYLHDNDLALRSYRGYLQLMPNAPEAAEVSALAAKLERAIAPPAAAVEPAVSTPAATQQTSAPAMTFAARTPAPAPTQTTERPTATARRPEVVTTTPPPVSAPPPEMVNVPPAPGFAINTTSSAPAQPREQQEAPVASQTAPESAHKTGLWRRINPAHWFGGGSAKKNYEAGGFTPLPSDGGPNAPTGNQPAGSTGQATVPPVYNAPSTTPGKPAAVIQPVEPKFARYLYLSPAKPAPGNRAAAQGAFDKARDFEADNRFADALPWYRQAATYDPSWFDAQYNTAILAFRQKDYRQTLTSFEMALAIQPDSADARYGFALALKNAGYVTDAVHELNKLIAAGVDEARVHLTLGNIYAQQYHDAARAREHYLKVLALDPNNSQASNIRFWLAANPQ